MSYSKRSICEDGLRPEYFKFLKCLLAADHKDKNPTYNHRWDFCYGSQPMRCSLRTRMDFLTALAASSITYTSSGEQDTRLLGTRGYAPPEQYGFSQTDARTDIYSLGVTLGQIMESQNYRRRYQRVVRKCTNLNPDRRYQTVRGVQRAFFPAKRNICCVLAMLLPICLLWNDFKMLPEKMTGPVAPEVTKMSEPVLTEIRYDGAAVYGYLGLQVEDIADMRGEEGTFLYDREESAGTYSYPGMKFEYKCKFILRIQLCKTIRK